MVECKYSVYYLSPGELVGGGPRPRKRPTIFIAYSFGSPQSKAFRSQLEQRIRRTPSLGDLIVLDGHVADGDSWPSEIRARLRRSNLVVADVTVLSPEVLFECGFAWGLSKTIISVTKEAGEERRLPRWITDRQVGHFSTKDDWGKLINSLNGHLKRKRKPSYLPKAGPAKPGRIFFLKHGEKSDIVESQIQYVSNRFGMEMIVSEVSDGGLQEIEADLATEVSACSLFVAPLLNVPADSFVHFASGIIVAKPTTGASKSHLSRRVIKIVSKPEDCQLLTADSARRVGSSVRVVPIDSVNRELVNYGRMYQKWCRRQEAD